MEHKRYGLYTPQQSSRGFTLLEIALSLAILSVVAIYTLDMYQVVSLQKKQVDDRSRMEEIVTALKAYYSGHESLPAVGASFADSVPVTNLGLGQSFRFDTFGRPYLFFPSATAAGITVDNRPAAGVVISLGGNQTQDYTLAGTSYITLGDDVLVPVEVNTEAVAIALAELETLGKRVEAYNRSFAGVQENPGTDYYGDTAAGAPPVIDPDYYDKYYPGVDATVDNHPELYPYTPYYLTNSGNPDFVRPNTSWPTSFPETIPPILPPTFSELVQHEPRNWPGARSYDRVILNIWEGDIAPTSANDWIWPPQGREPSQANDYAPFDGTLPVPPNYTLNADPDENDFFGVYPNPPYYLGTNTSALPAYELIDEGGCTLVGALPPTDPNCGFIYLDTNIYPAPPDGSGNLVIDQVNFIYRRYGLGTSVETDPWGYRYMWGGVGSNMNRYHLFYSAGPDGTPDTSDDVLLF